MNRLTKGTIGVLAAAAALLAAAVATGGEAAAPQSVRIKLNQQNRSGQSGTATLVRRGSTFVVTIKVSPPKKFPGTTQHAHIHNVTCARYRRIKGFDAQLATVVDTLNDLSKNVSRTTVYVPLAKRTTGRYSINVHEQNGPYTAVACGDIPRR